MKRTQKPRIRAISDCGYNCPRCNMRKGCFIWERENHQKKSNGVKEMRKTNDLMLETIENLYLLQGWAFADYEGSIETNATDQAKSDMSRVKKIGKAITILETCHKA